MRIFLSFALLLTIAACAVKTAETYPYGMTEKEWSALSPRDQVKIRRDFYFYEKGSGHLVNPNIEVEGKKEQPNAFMQQPAAAKKTAADSPAATPLVLEDARE